MAGPTTRAPFSDLLARYPRLQLESAARLCAAPQTGPVHLELPEVRAAGQLRAQTPVPSGSNRASPPQRRPTPAVEKRCTEGKKSAAPKDGDDSKLLSGSLDEFARQHGFVGVRERLPNYVGFVFGNVFKEARGQRQHWKDVDAGADHGEYSPRIQCYLVISAMAIKSVPPNQEAFVHKSIEPWQKGKRTFGPTSSTFSKGIHPLVATLTISGPPRTSTFGSPARKP